MMIFPLCRNLKNFCHRKIEKEKKILIIKQFWILKKLCNQKKKQFQTLIKINQH